MSLIAKRRRSLPISNLICPYCRINNVTQQHIDECEEKSLLISVIIPNRVGEKNITLDYIKQQTYKNIEVINVIDENKKGVDYCRNIGFEQSNGKFILFSNNNIEWNKEAISILYDSLINSKKEFSYCSYLIDGKITDKNLNQNLNTLFKRSYVESFESFEELSKKINSRLGVLCEQVLFNKHLKQEFASSKYNSKIADIVIPHHDRHDRLYECLNRLDNRLFYIHIECGGSFSENCNRGAEKAITDNIIFLNDDTLPNNQELIDLCNIDADIVGAAQKIPNVDGILYGIKFAKDNKRIKGEYAKVFEEALIPCGVAFLVKKHIWKKLGGLDERYKNGGEDSDFGLKALKNKCKIKFYPNPIFHYHSQSEGRLRYSKENQQLLNEIWNNDETRNMIFKKKVLITNNHLNRFGGSETFVYTIVKEFERKGYEVDVFTLTKEKIGMAKILEDYIVKAPKNEYDLILINHNTCLNYITENNIKGYKIFTSHGIYPQVEQAKLGADRYVSITEEVKEHLAKNGFESDLIINGIDCERFKPTEKINKKPKKVLSLCQGEIANKNIKNACEKLGLELVVFQEVRERIFEVEKYINEADIVFTLGRGAYESMACGRDVIVYDSRSYQENSSLADGRITKENFNEIIKNNCSGRRYKKNWKLEDIIEEIKNYKQENGEINREIALRELNIIDKIKQYENN